MPRAKHYLGLFLLGGIVLAIGAADLEVPKEVPDEPFDLSADRMEFTNETFVAKGSVTGHFENVVVRADKITGNPETGDIFAEGNIHFERDNILWQGSELNFNYLTQEGLFGPSTFYFDPVKLSVDHVERVSTNEYLLSGATFTTCPNEDPHVRMRAREASLVDEKYVKIKGATFYAGKVPIMYLPYWSHKLGDRIFTFRLGYGSRFGAFALTTTTLPVTKEVDWLTEINLYDRRGVGLGQGLVWDYPEAEGQFKAFYLKDQDPYVRYDSDEAKEQISKDRYRFQFEHLQNFTDTDYINTKWTYLSDPAVMEEFFKRRYRTEAQPENYASLVNGGSYLGSEAFVSKRLNNFYENTDIFEYSLDLYRTQLGNSPFYFESENSIGHFEQVNAKTNGPAVDGYKSFRIDTANTVYMPQRYGFLNLVPRAGYRATYYSKTDDSNSDNEELRHIPGAGMEVSFQATKVLSDRERWYGKGLRHKVEPYADYSYADSSVSSDELLQFDSVDKLDDENRVKLGLRNVFQTKRDGQLARFIDVDLYTYYRVERNGAEEDFDFLYMDARMPLAKRVILDMESIYDWYAGKFLYVNTRISYDRDEVIFSLEHLYQDSPGRSLWTPRVELFPDADISFESYARYDDNSNDVEEIAVIGYKNFCCMRYGLGFHYYDDGDQSVMFSVGLSDFPSARVESGF